MEVRPFDVRLNHQMVLTLEQRQSSDSGWQSVARTWYNQVRDQQWVWIDAEQWLPPGEYRLRMTDPASATGQTMRPAGEQDAAAIRCIAERTRLAVHIARQPGYPRFRIEGGLVEAAGASRLETILEPRQRVRLARQ